MQENPVGFSIITTVAGVLLATILIAVLGATLFMWVDTSNSTAAEPPSVAVAEDEAAAADVEENGATEASDAETVDAPGADEAVADEVATDEGEAVTAAPPEIATAFMKGTCTGCHVIPGVPNAVGITGPNLANIGTVAATRVEGQSAEEYIRASILAPEEYIAPDCPTGPCAAGIMLETFGTLLSEDELDGVVDYLLALHEE